MGIGVPAGLARAGIGILGLLGSRTCRLKGSSTARSAGVSTHLSSSEAGAGRITTAATTTTISIRMPCDQSASVLPGAAREEHLIAVEHSMPGLREAPTEVTSAAVSMVDKSADCTGEGFKAAEAFTVVDWEVIAERSS